MFHFFYSQLNNIINLPHTEHLICLTIDSKLGLDLVELKTIKINCFMLYFNVRLSEYIMTIGLICMHFNITTENIIMNSAKCVCQNVSAKFHLVHNGSHRSKLNVKHILFNSYT